MAALETESCACNGYVDLDVTHILTDSKTGFIKRSEGWVVRTKVKGSGFAAVATGDRTVLITGDGERADALSKALVGHADGCRLKKPGALHQVVIDLASA